MGLCSMTSLIRLLAKLVWMLYYVHGSGKAADNSSNPPTRVPVGEVFQVTNDPYVMQSSSGLFWLEFKQWRQSDDLDYCMAGVAYAKKGTGRVMWSFSSYPVLAGSAGCQLKLSNDGVLSFEHNGGLIAWHSNTPAGSAAHLTLTDEGNLVLQGQSNQTIWQSFDEPSIFIFPSGMMFTKNTTLYQRDLIAQFDFSIPTGNFSAKLSQSGDRLLLVSTHVNESLFVYYSLAAPNVAAAEFVMLGDTGIDFYANKGSKPLGTIVGNLGTLPPVESLIKCGGFFHEPDGNFILNYWNGSQFVSYYKSSITQCENPFQCGEYGLCNQSTGACSCAAGFLAEDGKNCKGTDDTQSLVPIPVVFHPQLSPLSVKSQDDCKTRCDKDPACNAALFDSESLSCSLFPILYTVMEGQNNSQLMFLKIPASHHKNLTEGTIIGMAVGIFGLVFVTCGGLALHLFGRRRRLHRNTLDHDELYLQELPRLPHRFSYKDLQVATEDFSRKLGEGGFGTVYAGVLVSNGGSVAVKKLKQGNTAASMDQFKMEVATIGNISHRNVVILKGFCMEEGARLLVYEFMARGSLDRWLFEAKGESEVGAGKGGVLDWERRCRIALDTAKGLEYLHHECAERIAHCDVKPENILLDENFNAKVADFGLAKLIGADKQSFVMSTLKGTRGYLAPEWLQHSTITAKSDVYSYGVVLLELISGRRCLEAERGYLPILARSVATSSASGTTISSSSSSSSRSGVSSERCAASIDIRRAEDVLLDERLRGNVAGHSLERMLLVALACVNAEPSDRPSMASVVQMLEGLVEVAPRSPLPPLMPSLL